MLINPWWCQPIDKKVTFLDAVPYRSWQRVFQTHHLGRNCQILPINDAHCYFTRLNLIKMGHFKFYFPVFLRINGHPKQKEFLNSCKWFHFVFWILMDHILSKRSLWQDKTTTRTAIRNFWPWHKDPWVWWTCLADYGQNCLILPKNYALFFFFLNKGKEYDFQLQMKVI